MFAFNVQGVEGAVYQMLNHGISTGALFLWSARRMNDDIPASSANTAGCGSQTPVYASIFLVTMLSSMWSSGSERLYW
jgi:NADH-quinone oxidoreductase subunit M